MRHNLLIAAVVAGASVLAPRAASAQLTLTGLACTSGNSLAFMGATSCSGAFVGNNKNQDLTAALAAFGAGTLVDRGASDDANGGPFTGNVSGTTGTLTFDMLLTGKFVIAVKAGNAFSLYYFLNAGPGVTSVQFTTAGTSLGGQTPNGLSHVSLYTVGALNVVPEPSTYALMATGMIGLVGVVRRRHKA